MEYFCYNFCMWEIDRTDEVKTWIEAQDDDAREVILEKLIVLKKLGPQLGRPTVDSVKGSSFNNMKELRIQNKNRVFRIFFAFDPERKAILLIGGDKKGINDFYEKMIHQADKLYSSHLEELRRKKDDKKRKK